MILIDKGISDLIAGYDRIYQAENLLRRRWRQPLLLAYSKRREDYEAELSLYRKRSSDFRNRFRIGIWLSSALLILGAVAFPALILLGELGSLRGPLLCFSPILILAGLNGWALLGMLWMWQKERKKPPPPPNPLDNKITEQLISDWRQGLQGSIQTNKTDVNPGIFHFIARLQSLDEKYYFLDSLNLSETGQTDLIVIGPKGIWVFEVIHINGVISWSDGVWTRSRGIHSLQKDEQVVLAQDEQAFETVWDAKASRISALLEKSNSNAFVENTKFFKARGGLVFTHPQARFVIPPGVRFNWGITRFWVEKIGDVPEIKGWDERTSLQVIQTLLYHHQEITNSTTSRSMLLYADELIRQSEDGLKSWISEG